MGHRYVIQYFHLKRPTNIKAELDSTWGETATLFATISGKV